MPPRQWSDGHSYSWGWIQRVWQLAWRPNGPWSRSIRQVSILAATARMAAPAPAALAPITRSFLPVLSNPCASAQVEDQLAADHLVADADRVELTPDVEDHLGDLVRREEGVRHGSEIPVPVGLAIFSERLEETIDIPPIDVGWGRRVGVPAIRRRLFVRHLRGGSRRHSDPEHGPQQPLELSPTIALAHQSAHARPRQIDRVQPRPSQPSPVGGPDLPAQDHQANR